MQQISVFLDISDDYKGEVLYTLKNILYPYENTFIIEKDVSKWLESSNRMLYCNEKSSLLSNVDRLNKVIVIILEDSTLKYFKSKEAYDIKNTIYLDEVCCIFPLSQQLNSLYENEVVMKFDIVSSSYFFLSCWQEKYINKFDDKGRVLFEETLQYKLNIFTKPIVNQYLNLLEDLTKRSCFINFKIYPNNLNIMKR